MLFIKKKLNISSAMSGVKVATSCYRLSSSFRTLLPHTQRLLRTLPSSVTASHARLSLVR